MAQPLRRDLTARRNAPFAEVWTFTEEDGTPVDFTGATVTMQVRLYGAQPGDALVDLAAVGTALTEGLVVSAGQVAVFIDSTTLAFLPGSSPGATDKFEYDLKVKRTGIVAELWRYGLFSLKPGVTDRTFILATEADDFLLAETGAYLLAE